MKLVIAEKPSVAMSIATVLGVNEKKDGYLEGGEYLVSWCVGHLLELAQPEACKMALCRSADPAESVEIRCTEG